MATLVWNEFSTVDPKYEVLYQLYRVESRSKQLNYVSIGQETTDYNILKESMTDYRSLG